MWLDTHPYDPETGEGSIGVEFAGSAVSSPCPYGQNISLASKYRPTPFALCQGLDQYTNFTSDANNYSSLLEGANRELQWQVSISFLYMFDVLEPGPTRRVLRPENRMSFPSGLSLISADKPNRTYTIEATMS